MALKDVNNISNDFNKKSEKDIENKIKGYDLSKDEKSQIWQAVQERDKNIEQEKSDVLNPDIFDQRHKAEIKKLKEKEQLNLNLNMGNRNMPTDLQRSNMAWNNVHINSTAKIKELKQKAEQKINAVLQNARNNGRGQETHQDRQQDNNNNHDNDRR